MINSFKILYHDLKESVKDLLPIVSVVAFFQIFIVGNIPPNLDLIAIGLFIVAIGLALFIRGLEVGIFPIGENLAYEFAKKGSLFWLLCFAFMLGFSTTIAEPALIAISQKAEIISSNRIDSFFLRLTVAFSVGFALCLGTFRILTGHAIQYYIISGYILVVLITFIAPPEIVGLAYDSGGVTTSTVTVPLVAALGIGLASSIKGRNPIIDGFGLIAFASLTPMIFVQVYGVVVYSFVDSSTAIASVITQSDIVDTFLISDVFWGLLSVIKDVLPIFAVILFFQYLIIKKQVATPHKIIIGIILVIFGLYAFVLGLDIALFPIGESVALELTSMDNIFTIYLFGFLIGFSTTMAEPALIAIAIKVGEVSDNKIKEYNLRVAVAVGVAFGVSLGIFRIISGDDLHYYVIAGYSVVIVMTYFAPKYIIPIAYDSGGVTTSTVTVPLIAALGLGLASNMEGRDPLIDGFGLIAFASLFPIITVMGYGIYVERKKRRIKDMRFSG